MSTMTVVFFILYNLSILMNNLIILNHQSAKILLNKTDYYFLCILSIPTAVLGDAFLPKKPTCLFKSNCNLGLTKFHAP